MHEVKTTKKFDKQVFKLIENDSKLEIRISKIIKLLQIDPHSPSLKLHKLGGENNWSVRVTGNIRIILNWQHNLLFCLQIGTHDDVY